MFVPMNICLINLNSADAIFCRTIHKPTPASELHHNILSSQNFSQPVLYRLMHPFLIWMIMIHCSWKFIAIHEAASRNCNPALHLPLRLSGTRVQKAADSCGVFVFKLNKFSRWLSRTCCVQHPPPTSPFVIHRWTREQMQIKTKRNSRNSCYCTAASEQRCTFAVGLMQTEKERSKQGTAHSDAIGCSSPVWRAKKS